MITLMWITHNYSMCLRIMRKISPSHRAVMGRINCWPHQVGCWRREWWWSPQKDPPPIIQRIYDSLSLLITLSNSEKRLVMYLKQILRVIKIIFPTFTDFEQIIKTHCCLINHKSFSNKSPQNLNDQNTFLSIINSGLMLLQRRVKYFLFSHKSIEGKS